MQQPKSQKATRALYDDLRANNLLRQDDDYGSFYEAFDTNPQYQEAIYSHYRSQKDESGQPLYDLPGSSQEWVEMYRLKDAMSERQPVIEGRPGAFSARMETETEAEDRTFRNLDKLANPALGAPRVSPGTRERINQVSEVRQMAMKPVSTEETTETMNRMMDQREKRVQSQFNDFSASDVPGQQPAVSDVPATTIQRPEGLGDSAPNTQQDRSIGFGIPDLPGVREVDANSIQLIDFGSPTFEIKYATPDQIGVLRNQVAQDLVEKDFSDLTKQEKAAVNRYVSQRYVPREIGESVLLEMGYDRETDGLETFWNQGRRAFENTFVNFMGGVAQQELTNINRGYRATPFATMPVYNPHRDQRDDGEIRQSVANDVQRMEEAIARRLTVDPEQDSFFMTAVPQALGSATAFMASSIGTRGSGAIALGAQSGKMQGYREAIEAGATEEEANAIGAIFGTLGATEGLPIASALGRMGKYARKVGKTSPMRTIAKGMGSNAFEEAMQEGVSGFLQGLTLNEYLGLNEAFVNEELFEQIAAGAISGGVLGAGTSVMGAIRQREEELIRRATEEEAARLLEARDQRESRYINAVVQAKDEQSRAIDQEIQSRQNMLSSIPEDSSAPVAKRYRSEIEQLAELRDQMDDALSAVVDNNRNAQSPDQLIDPAQEIGIYIEAAENLMESMTTARESVLEESINEQKESEQATQTEPETADTQTQSAEQTKQPSETQEQIASAKAPQEQAAQEPVEAETLAVSVESSEQAGQKSAQQPEAADPLLDGVSEEDSQLVQRARESGEDSSYKAARNKVRRVFKDNGSVDYAIKETSRGISIIRENEQGDLVSRNLKTGKESVLGEKSAIRKSFYRGRPVTESRPVIEQAEQGQKNKEVEQPLASPVLEEEAVEVDQVEQTLEQRAGIRPEQKRFVDQIPEAIRTRVLSDLAGETNPAEFREFLKSLPKETQDAYKARRAAGNPVLTKHNTSVIKSRSGNRAAETKERNSTARKINDAISKAKVDEIAREKLKQVPIQSIRAVQDAVSEAALENPDISDSEIDSVFRTSLKDNRLSRFVSDLAKSISGLQEVTENSESLGFQNPADLARHIAERMLLSGGKAATNWHQNARGATRTKKLTSAANIIRQGIGQGAYSRIQSQAAENSMRIPVAQPSSPNSIPQRAQAIMSKLSSAIGVQFQFRSVPGAYGYYNPKTKQAFIRFKGDLTSFAHEIAHFVDDKFGVTGRDIDLAVMNELLAWARTSPSYDDQVVTSDTNLQEGFAMFMVNMAINPEVAKGITPRLNAWYESRVDESTKNELSDFSEAFRTYYHNSTLSTDASNIRSLASPNVDSKAQQIKKTLSNKVRATFGTARSKADRQAAGQLDQREIRFLNKVVMRTSSLIDTLPRALTEGMVTTKKGIRNLYRALGNELTQHNFLNDAMNDLNNAVTKVVGKNGMIEAAMVTRLLNPKAQANGQRAQAYLDEDGNEISFFYIHQAFDSSSVESLQDDQDKTTAALTNERIVEIIARNLFGSKDTRDKMKLQSVEKSIMDDDSLSPLDKGLRIKSAIDAHNAASPDSQIEVPTVSGSAAYDQTDLDRAISQLRAEEVLRTGNDAQQKQYARIQEGKKRYRAVSDMLLQYMRDTGRISDKVYQKIKDNNQYYASMQRIFSLTPDIEAQRDGKAYRGNYGLTSVDQPLSKAKGSEQEIADPFESLFQNIGRIITESNRNELVSTILTLYADAINMTSDPSLAGATASLVDEVTDYTETDDGGMTRLRGTIVNHGDVHASGKIVQMAYVDGQARWYLVDSVIADELEHMYRVPAPTSILSTAIRSTVKAWKQLITTVPAFPIKNGIRDIPSQSMLSEVPGALGLNGWSKDLVSQQIRDDFAASGASQAGHFNRHVPMYEAMQRFVWEEMANDKTDAGKVRWAMFRPPSNLLQIALDGKSYGRKFRKYQNLALNRFYQESEEINRRREYIRAHRYAIGELGMTPYQATMYAATKARGILDYSVGGRLSLYMNQYFPFHNARMQGLRKLGDLFSASVNNSERAAIAGIRFASLVMAPTVMQMMVLAAADDEYETLNQYANLPDWQRYYFWNVPMGANDWLSIPKPFDFGVIGTAIESMALSAALDDDRFTSGMIGELWRTFAPINPESIYQAGGPLMVAFELKANYNFFFDSSITPDREEGMAPNLRKSDETATFIGKGIQNMFSIMGFDVNAKKADYVVEKVLGGWGRLAVKSAKSDPVDALVNMVGLFRSSPSFNSKDYNDAMQFIQYINARNKEPYRSQIDYTQQLFIAAMNEPDDERSQELINRALNGPIKRFAEIWRDEEQREAAAKHREFELRKNR